MKDQRSRALFEQALRYIPGGVNSPVRAFRAVGGTPRFMARAEGAFLFDEDGNRYIDLINSWGPMILGHNHPEVVAAIEGALAGSTSFGAPTAREVEMAEQVCAMVPSIQKVRMVNSGTEATMSAIRVARGYTGRDKIVKMEGCYHGHADAFLIAAGSGALTQGTPDSRGVTVGTARDTLLVPYNDLDALETLLKKNTGEISAVIVEPVVGNMGCVLPHDEYLQGLRTLCDAHGALLIFDEVMTGFRLARGGAQECYGVTPDLTTLGKIIGGGLPVGAYGGRREVMDKISPAGPVYQAGTLSGNPLAMAAGLAVLRYLDTHQEVYDTLAQRGGRLAAGLKKVVDRRELPCSVNQVGSMFTLFFTREHVTDYATAKKCDIGSFGRFFHAMLDRGVYMAPAQFEAMFLSIAVTDDLIDTILQAVDESLVVVGS